MDYNAIIDKYYGAADSKLKDLLIEHSQSVTQRALQIVFMHPELDIDTDFIEEAAMLHDIGIVGCNAPGIFCTGSEPYICHGIIGAEMLRSEGYPEHARVCERHTGAGITSEEIASQHLPLPQRDYLPETIEEIIICYADKFFSKSHPEKEKTYEEAQRSLAKFGEAGVERFKKWHDMLEAEKLK